MSVQKSGQGAIEVASSVYSVRGITSSGPGDQLFPHPHLGNNFCYAVVDHLRRQCFVFYHAMLPFW